MIYTGIILFKKFISLNLTLYLYKLRLVDLGNIENTTELIEPLLEKNQCFNIVKDIEVNKYLGFLFCCMNTFFKHLNKHKEEISFEQNKFIR